MIKTILKLIGIGACSLILFFLILLRIDQKPIIEGKVNNKPQTVEATPEPTPEVKPVVLTPSPSPTPTPSPTPEPEPEYFTLSFIGDCTLAPPQERQDFHNVINGDYSYPFKNTVSYFKDDDLTIGNLECTFSDVTRWSVEWFYFQSPPEYAQILVEGSVELVTTANNHTNDFGEDAINDTAAALDEYNIAHAGNDSTTVVETESGLKVGMYSCTYSHITEQRLLAGIEKLKAEGVDLIVLALHWGQELVYEPTEEQISLAHTAIDNGANIIYGSHPHCLGPVEEYNGGIIMYSMGNWSFGGNTNPKDPDTAIVQVSVKRDLDGIISTEGFKAIPCCVSSRIDDMNNNVYGYNDYCPTPYEEGSDNYIRTMTKLIGEFDGSGIAPDYSGWMQR